MDCTVEGLAYFVLGNLSNSTPGFLVTPAQHGNTLALVKCILSSCCINSVPPEVASAIATIVGTQLAEDFVTFLGCVKTGDTEGVSPIAIRDTLLQWLAYDRDSSNGANREAFSVCYGFLSRETDENDMSGANASVAHVYLSVLLGNLDESTSEILAMKIDNA